MLKNDEVLAKMIMKTVKNQRSRLTQRLINDEVLAETIMKVKKNSACG